MGGGRARERNHSNYLTAEFNAFDSTLTTKTSVAHTQCSLTGNRRTETSGQSRACSRLVGSWSSQRSSSEVSVRDMPTSTMTRFSAYPPAPALISPETTHYCDVVSLISPETRHYCAVVALISPRGKTVVRVTTELFISGGNRVSAGV